MGYRIRIVPEVEAWLDELRNSDPGAADLVDEALDALREGGAGLGPPLVVPVPAQTQETPPDLDFSYQRPAGTSRPAPPPQPASLPLSELRPGAPESTGIRILFTVDHSGTAVLLAAGTEREWLQAWYAETVLHCRTRYERDYGSAG
jgi:hypothetical protein